MSVSVRLLMAPPTELNRMAAASMDPELRGRLHASLQACYELAAPELAATIVPWLDMLAGPCPVGDGQHYPLLQSDGATVCQKCGEVLREPKR